jgi:hypothetical protein
MLKTTSKRKGLNGQRGEITVFKAKKMVNRNLVSLFILLSLFVIPLANLGVSPVLASQQIPSGSYTVQARFADYTILPDSAIRSVNFEHKSWGIEHMNTNSYAQRLIQANNATGSSNNEVIVAVIDSGIDIHHPFFGNKVLPGANTVAGESNDLVHDRNGHGTAMAGIIADVTHGIPEIKILPIKALDNWGRGEGQWISDAIDIAIARGADIINMSLGWTVRQPQAPTIVTSPLHPWIQVQVEGDPGNLEEIALIERAVQRAVDRGITVIVAAGNENSSTLLHTPSRMENVITVTAVDINNKRASFSNFGRNVDVAAPGVNVIAPFTGSRYISSSGTSPAAAHVSAIAAMYKLNNPSLTPEQTRQAIRRHVNDLGGWNMYTGAGIPNLANAPVRNETAEPAPPVITPTPTPTPSVPSDFADIQGHWAENAAMELISAGIVNGIQTADGSIVVMPESSVTRAQFIRMMAALSQDAIPAPSNISPATDISAAAWYSPYFRWAANTGLIAGYEDGTMRPDALISRQEMAVILARYMELKAINTPSINTSITKLLDEDSIAPWAFQSFLIMRRLNIINGDQFGYGNPTANASRAESMTMIWNLSQL